MDEGMDLPATLDVVDGPFSGEDDSQEEEAVAWGRLFSMGRGFTSIDFTKDTYVFGRDPLCDYSFSNSSANGINPHTQAFSKYHFKVHKEGSGDSVTVLLEDTSSNGTFVNGEKVGKNNKVPLSNNDEISLALAKNRAFVYMETNTSESENSKLPEDFRQRYMMSRVLGRGACGEVKLAFERGTCAKFAVKVISKKTFSVGPRIGPAIMDEVKILKELDHPCIIGIEDVFESPDALYLVLELVEGGELFDRVVSIGKFSEAQAKLLFYQMLQAVNYLHERNITHRDLKPENILLATESNETLIKVTDFGLSRFVGETSLMKTLCGTPTYLAPEIVTSAGLAGAGYGKAVDCWSLGVILFICLAGYPPFSDEIEEYTLKEQITKGIYSFPKEFWKNVSNDAKHLVERLLTVDPTKRSTAQEALTHTWLQDEEMAQKAAELMKEGCKNKPRRMPPPSLPDEEMAQKAAELMKEGCKNKPRRMPPPSLPDEEMAQKAAELMKEGCKNKPRRMPPPSLPDEEMAQKAAELMKEGCKNKPRRMPPPSLPDEEMAQKAAELMKEGCKNKPRRMPPPSLPPQKRHSAGSSDGEHEAKRAQLVTPPLGGDSSPSSTNSTEASPGLPH